MTPGDPKQPGAENDALSLSDEEQTRTGHDQQDSDRGQAAGDRDLGSRGDPGVHQFSRDIRQRAARGREQTAHTRLDDATRRDEMWLARDVAAARRDEIADGWDGTMADLDAAFEECFGPVAVTASEIVMRFGEHRKCARKYREQAAAHRAHAAADRRAAAEDRLRAAHDRLLAAADREALAHHLASISATA